MEPLPLRAARYFGVHDKPRTSVKVGTHQVAIVVHDDRHPLFLLYDEEYRSKGMFVKLTDKRRADLLAALGAER